MEIAFIVDEFPSVSQTFVLNQIVGLLQRGHHVDIFTRIIHNGCVEHPDIERYRLRERVQRLACPRGRGERAIAATRLALAHVNRPQALAGALNVARYGRRALSLSLLIETAPFYRGYDIVHCQFGHNGNFGAALKWLGLQRKLVVTFHGCDIRAGLECGGAIYRELWQQVDCLIAISQYNRECLLRMGADAEKIVDHPVGIDRRRFRFRAPVLPSRRVIRLLTVARLVEEKGLFVALDAVARLRQQRPNLMLDYRIIGEGPLRADIERHIDRLELRRQVRLSGALAQNEVAEAMSRADVFLLPSIAEALPVSLMEAQAIGMPVVATRVGSVDQIVQDGISGFLAAPGDCDDLCNCLNRLLERSQDWPAMARAGCRHIEANFDIERLNDRLVDLYERVLAA
jgi:colanic acid/amylovoran biosynthesis glycosyltransferase